MTKLPSDVGQLQALIFDILDGGGCDECHGTGQIVTGFVDGPSVRYPIAHRCTCMDRKPSFTWSDERRAIVAFLRGYVDRLDIKPDGLDDSLQQIADLVEIGEHTRRSD